MVTLWNKITEQKNNNIKDKIFLVLACKDLPIHISKDMPELVVCKK
jgi:hypothetical protein